MKLLVSVRGPDEVEAALAGGAALLDVKEPSRGSLGRADDPTLEAVVRAVAGRRPVSAARGELGEAGPPLPVTIAYAKWGLFGWGGCPSWREELPRAAERLPATTRPVAVAYADWPRADAPRPAEVCAFAAEARWGALLIDTWDKDGTTLLDWLTPEELAGLRDDCARAGLPLALAGSLGPSEIEKLLFLHPDWFAVRGAACAGGQRTGRIDAEAVRRLVTLVAAGNYEGLSNK
jgi:hypothetical protein